jgi:hypothetical protein
MTTVSDPSLSNPFSTGSGGTTFEQLVGASYLVALLAGHIPRGLDWGITKEIRFQQRWSGCLIDDLAVTSTDGTQERRLALQIKHNLSFVHSDQDTFPRVIQDCWDVFTSAFGWQFNPNTDRIGIGVGVYQAKLDEHFRPLLEWARTSQMSTEFFEKVNTSVFSSSEKRGYIELLRERLEEAKGSSITDEELWQFLKCLVVLHFDLENAGSRDTVQCWNTLLDVIEARNYAQAHTLFDTLCAIVARNNRTAGYLDLAKVKSEVPTLLFSRLTPNTATIYRLASFTKTLAEISLTIGRQVRCTHPTYRSVE